MEQVTTLTCIFVGLCILLLCNFHQEAHVVRDPPFTSLWPKANSKLLVLPLKIVEVVEVALGHLFSKISCSSETKSFSEERDRYTYYMGMCVYEHFYLFIHILS